MRNFLLALSAFSLAIPTSMAFPTSKAEARRHHHYNSQSSRNYYNGQSTRDYRRCRHSSGTAGLVAGGVGGALLGRSILGHGALGTVAGGVGGAFAGRAIDRTISAPNRCR